MFFTTTESYFADCKNHKICLYGLSYSFPIVWVIFLHSEKIRHFEGFLLTVHQSTTIGALEMWIPTPPAKPWAKVLVVWKAKGFRIIDYVR